MGFDEVLQSGDETHYFLHHLTDSKAQKFYAAKARMLFWRIGRGR